MGKTKTRPLLPAGYRWVEFEEDGYCAIFRGGFELQETRVHASDPESMHRVVMEKHGLKSPTLVDADG